MFLLKAFLVSKMDIHQILRLIYFKKLQEWRTDDVAGDCISFKLNRNTENSTVLFKKWRKDFRKEAYCQIYQQFFFLRVNSD